MNYNNLKKYGLSDCFEKEAALYNGLFLARVCEQHHDLYNLMGEEGELQATVSGKLAYDAEDNTKFPAVGDWVMIDRNDSSTGNAIIHHVLKRKSTFERKASGRSNSVQIVAANIDLIFICMSLNTDFNLRRLERYLSIAWNSGAVPVIVLTKADLCEDLSTQLLEIESVSIGTDVVTCSSIEENGYQNIIPYINEGKTIAFIGSSGVGKSTLINRLMGRDVLVTKEIRDDDRGRHTTTHRELLLLPNGGIVIDTPGMRELRLDSGDDISKSFEDIEELAAVCKFKDCSHTKEPGCAIKNAIEAGELSEERFESYKKLQIEISYEGLNSRQLEQAKIKRMFADMGGIKQAKQYLKEKYKR